MPASAAGEALAQRDLDRRRDVRRGRRRLRRGRLRRDRDLGVQARRRRGRPRSARARPGSAAANCVPAVPSILPLGPGMEGPGRAGGAHRRDLGVDPRLAAYEPECVVCLTGPAGERDESEARGIVVEGLQLRCRRRREVGVRFGLEPVHASQRETVLVRELDPRRRSRCSTRPGSPTSGSCSTRTTSGTRRASRRRRSAHVDRIAGVHVADCRRRAGAQRPRAPGRRRRRRASSSTRSPRGLGRLPRRRDLLDARPVLGLAPRRGRPPRLRRRAVAPHPQPCGSSARARAVWPSSRRRAAVRDEHALDREIAEGGPRARCEPGHVLFPEPGAGTEPDAARPVADQGVAGDDSAM